MARTTGSADLPLHGGRVPPWLRQRMEQLGRLTTEAIVLHYGREEFLRRLAQPFWFQSFGAVMGMDWHSSGITTSVMGALKRGLAPVAGELGIHVCGGRGRHSRRTPAELVAVGEHRGLDGERLARTSRLVAKVDSAAVQDDFDIYLHSFVVTDDGSWVVVQQGMNPERKLARRYHWHSDHLVGGGDLIEEPHSAIEDSTTDGDDPERRIVNLTDRRADPSRRAQLELIEHGPDRIVDELARLKAAPVTRLLPHLELPAHHEVTHRDVDLRRLHGTLVAVAEQRQDGDFEELLLQPGVGRRALFSLALVAEVVHGAPCRFEDPGRYSLAHGGKDGHPFPVPLHVYDETIGVLKRAVGNARLDRREELDALQRLDRQARLAERWLEHEASPGDVAALPSFDAFVRGQRKRSERWGGRTVFDDRPPQRLQQAKQPKLGRGQLDLFGG